MIKINDCITEKLLTRFWSKVNKTDSCWEWSGLKNDNGYGQTTIRKNKKSYSVLAHRVSWVIHNKQDFPEDKPVARHICNNPACVRPDHIIPGTQADNIHDAVRAGRAGMTGKKHSPATIKLFKSLNRSAIAEQAFAYKKLNPTQATPAN
jgi:hypothetical protein